MKFAIYQGSRQGPRESNEDRTAYSYSREALLVVLADGMGGHQHGEVAAEIAVRTLTECFQQAAMPILHNPARFLNEAILQAHQAILAHIEANDLLEHPRTTIVAAVAQNNVLHVAHAGDSRFYHIRDGKVISRTEDHSKVQLLFRRGLLNFGQMGLHPERNKIYNCLGSEILPKVEVSPRYALHDGDTVMLCSDGLWSLVGDEKMAGILCEDTVNASVPALLDLAESRIDANSDNISAIAFNWGGVVTKGAPVPMVMPLDTVTTILLNPYHSKDEAAEAPEDIDLSEDAIDLMIADIQATLNKVPK